MKTEEIDQSLNPSEQADQHIASQELSNVLQTHLKPREVFILMERFGFNHPLPTTQEDIGKQLGVSKSAIFSMEHRALRVLRHKPLRRLQEIYPSFCS